MFFVSFVCLFVSHCGGRRKLEFEGGVIFRDEEITTHEEACKKGTKKKMT